MKTITISLLLFFVVVADRYAMIFGTAPRMHNYSITSDPCRAYDDFIKMGIAPENIIYMSFTDVVTSSKNPYPGMLFTDPSDNTSGDWVKYGCLKNIDYDQPNITPAVFLAIVSGDAAKVSQLTGITNPKVINATSEDNVFMYFMDHGDYGFIYVDDHSIDKRTLRYSMDAMYEKKLFKNLLIFMEACYSGSMWASYPYNRRTLIITSSDESHPADMSNCPPNDCVAGKCFGVCMSGLYDNSYLSYIEQHPDATIDDVYHAVAAECAAVSQQGVSYWGDMSLMDMKISDFLGSMPAKKCTKPVEKADGIVSLPDVPKHNAMWAAIRANTEFERAESMKELERIVMAEAKMEVEAMRLGSTIIGEKKANLAQKQNTMQYNASCMENLAQSLIRQCGNTATLSMKIMNILRGVCGEVKITPNVDWNSICLK